MGEHILIQGLTSRQRRLICNGCGPKGWGWLVPDLSFRRAADQHDLDYWQGNRARDKIVADWRFLNGCLAGAWHSSGARAWLLIALSFVYFAAVFLGGWFSFNFGHRREWADLSWAIIQAEASRHLGDKP